MLECAHWLLLEVEVVRGQLYLAADSTQLPCQVRLWRGGRDVEGGRNGAGGEMGRWLMKRKIDWTWEEGRICLPNPSPFLGFSPPAKSMQNKCSHAMKRTSEANTPQPNAMVATVVPLHHVGGYISPLYHLLHQAGLLHFNQKLANQGGFTCRYLLAVKRKTKIALIFSDAFQSY